MTIYLVLISLVFKGIYILHVDLYINNIIIHYNTSIISTSYLWQRSPATLIIDVHSINTQTDIVVGNEGVSVGKKIGTPCVS